MFYPKSISSQKYDVLIIDEVGSSYIKHCIPDSVSFSVLPIRSVIPWVPTLRFILRVVFRLINLQSFKEVVLFSVVDVLDPKVMITFIDNASIIGRLQVAFPEKLVISVQNGFRSRTPISGFSEKYPMPVLYGFGKFEKYLLESKNIDVKEYIPVGSLIYGIYKQYSVNTSKYDICYISSFVHNAGYSEALLYMEYEKKVFHYLVKFCKKKGLRLSVAMKSEECSEQYIDEFKFFKEMDVDNIAELVPNKKSSLQSYHTASSSEVIVCTLSTLGIELFGGGKKVLFIASADNFRLARAWGVEENFRKMPDIVLLNRLNIESISIKLEVLLYMDQHKYLVDTEQASIYYMDNRHDHYPHVVIKNRIDSYLASYNQCLDSSL